MANLEVKNITKYYNKNFLAVDNLSFHAQNGDLIGLLGVNGAGKSTIIKMLTGYIKPTSGTITIDNENLSKKILSRIGYLPEHNPLYTDMYVIEYLRIFARIYNIEKQKIKDRIDYVIQECNLQEMYKKRIENLSKGYRQRVGLARVLLPNPDILILDEPVSGLDPCQIIYTENLLKKLSIEKIIILSTHVLQEVTNICNRFIVIDHGHLKHDSITTKDSLEVLHKMFNNNNIVFF